MRNLNKKITHKTLSETVSETSETDRTTDKRAKRRYYLHQRIQPYVQEVDGPGRCVKVPWKFTYYMLPAKKRERVNRYLNELRSYGYSVQFIIT